MYRVGHSLQQLFHRFSTDVSVFGNGARVRCSLVRDESSLDALSVRIFHALLGTPTPLRWCYKCYFQANGLDSHLRLCILTEGVSVLADSSTFSMYSRSSFQQVNSQSF